MNVPNTNIAQKRRFVNFELDDATIAELDRLASKSLRSRSAEARYAVLNHIAAEQAEESAEASTGKAA